MVTAKEEAIIKEVYKYSLSYKIGVEKLKTILRI